MADYPKLAVNGADHLHGFRFLGAISLRLSVKKYIYRPPNTLKNKEIRYNKLVSMGLESSLEKNKRHNAFTR